MKDTPKKRQKTKLMGTIYYEVKEKGLRSGREKERGRDRWIDREGDRERERQRDRQIFIFKI